MPFRHVSEFDPETVNIMTAAYDAVVERLSLKPDDPRRGILVSLIVSLTKAGVLDVEKLADQARAGLK